MNDCLAQLLKLCRQKPGYRLTTDLRDWLELADAMDLNPIELILVQVRILYLAPILSPAGGIGRHTGFKTRRSKEHQSSTLWWATKFIWAADGIGRHAGLRNLCLKKRWGSNP